MIEKYLKEVCNIYSEQKAIRVKRTCEKKRMMRLESLENKSIENNRTKKSFDDNSINKKSFDDDNSINKNNYHTNQLKTIDDATSSQEDEQKMHFTAEEMQMFEEENKFLYQEMNATMDEVK